MTARRLLGWLPAVVVVPAVVAAGVAVTVPEDHVAAMRAEQPLDPGTTWVYDVLDHGRPSGTRTSQVVGRATLLDPGAGGLLPSSEVTRTWTAYPGVGRRSFTAYLAVRGSRVVQYAQEEGGRLFRLTPAATAYQLPVEPGTAWSYDGAVDADPFSFDTELTEVVDVEVGGHTFADCAHFVTRTPQPTDEQPDAVDVYEEWTCDGVGTVRTRDVNAAVDLDLTEELTEFHGVEGDWYAAGHGPEPVGAAPVAGAQEGFGPTRTYAVPDGTLGREVAWTDLRPERALVPPVSDGEVMVLAEPDGAVSARTLGTGEVRWRVQLRGPVLATPVVVGDVVLVADSQKRVWALSTQTGLARWTRTLPDVVSAAPVVAGDAVAVPSDDGTLTMLGLTDGRERWTLGLGGPARTAPAYDGAQLLVGDTSGTLSSVDPDSGEVTWSASLDTGLSAGPVAADGVVMAQDGDGVVHAFEPDGTLAWQSRTRGASPWPLVSAHGVVVTLTNLQRLSGVSTADGRRRWTRSLPTTDAPPAVVGDELVVTTRDGEVLVLDLATGRLVDRWRLPSPADDAEWFVDVEPALVGDSLVVSAWAGGAVADTVLFAYPVRPDPQRGLTVRLTGHPVPGTPNEAVVRGGDALVLANGSDLYALAPDGSSRVLLSSPDALQTGAAVTRDGDVVVARAGDHVEARRLRDGARLWRAPGGPPGVGSVPALGDRTAYWGDSTTGLRAVDLRTGRPRWTAPVADQLSTPTPLLLPDGDVVYGGGGLARYDGATGEPVWSDPTAQLFGPASYAGGLVFATALSATGPARTGAWEAATGRPVWQVDAADPPLAVGPVVGDGVVVAVDGTVVHAYDAATGAELWSLDLHREPAGAPYVADGRVFLTARGVGGDLDDEAYRVSVHDVHTGRYLTAWEPGSTPISRIPNVGGDSGVLLLPTGTALVELEVS